MVRTFLHGAIDSRSWSKSVISKIANFAQSSMPFKSIATNLKIPKDGSESRAHQMRCFDISTTSTAYVKLKNDLVEDQQILDLDRFWGRGFESPWSTRLFLFRERKLKSYRTLVYTRTRTRQPQCTRFMHQNMP